jgi:hypothetical protein
MTGLLTGGVIVLALVGGCTKQPGDAGSQPVADRAATSEKFAVSFSAETSGSGGPRGPNESAGTRPVATEPPAAPHGKIIGVVKWTGPLPKLDPVLVNKEAHVCAEHGKHDRESESLIVNGSNGGLKDAVVYLFGRFEDGKSLSELKHPDTLNQRVCSYEPRVFVVPVGARLSITSEDEVGHNVRMQGAADLNIAVSKGGRTSRKFEQAGLVKVGCDIHPWMTGYIHVAKQPYYAVTDTDGQFELTDVPPGEHQIKLWHGAWWPEDGRIASPIVSTHSVTVYPGETTIVTFDLSDPALTQIAKKAPARAGTKR